jgi:hypothetical protein
MSGPEVVRGTVVQDEVVRYRAEALRVALEVLSSIKPYVRPAPMELLQVAHWLATGTDLELRYQRDGLTQAELWKTVSLDVEGEDD